MTRALWLAIGAALAVLPWLPPINPTAKGLLWAPQVQSWIIGTIVVAVLGLLGGRLAHQAGFAPRWRTPSPRLVIPILAVLLTGLSSWVMLDIFAGNPHLVDEMAQLLHARAFAAGRIGAPVPNPPDAFFITHTWITNNLWFSQYPPGETAFLALGLLFKAEWLVNPVLAGLGVFCLYYAARGLYGPKTALTAAFLWVAAPWVMFMSGTYLNHVGATTLALATCAILWGPRQHRWWHAALAGLAIAGVAAHRPLDAVAVAIPVVIWIVRRRQWLALPLMAVGGAPILIAWGWFNWRIFGSALTLGYDILYGQEHGLGFHADPWGDVYSPAVGLSNMVLAVQRLNMYLYEWPIPAMLPVIVWALAGRQRTWCDFVLGTAAVAAPILYFFYWHSGYYLGPRFYFAAAPFLVIATARAWRWGWKAARLAPRRWIRGDVALATAAAVVLVWGWIEVLPQRVLVYRTSLATMKQHPERELAARGVHQALVLVPESWGSRVMVSLWALGVTPGTVERAYRRLDTCDLYYTAGMARSAEVESGAIESRLVQDMILAPPAPPRMETWPDPSIKLKPGSPPEACQIELRRDLAGFTLYGYLAWRNRIGLDSGIVFARALFERNPALFRRYPGWEVWRYAPPPGRPDMLPVLTRVSP
ncbi:MAG: hypothetical protein EXR93_03175 [Gemmatimonadetes bacterium]|nr:hypothetical protein [Gemmatimonadota bacterium]